MTIVLDDWWEVASFIGLCVGAMALIAYDLWRSVRPLKDRPPEDRADG